MSSPKYYQQNSELLSKKTGKELLIIDKKSGTFTKIGGISLFIWKKLTKKINFNELLKTILNEYQVEEKIAKKDLESFLRESLKNKFIKIVDK